MFFGARGMVASCFDKSVGQDSSSFVSQLLERVLPRLHVTVIISRYLGLPACCQLQLYSFGLIAMCRHQSDFATTKAWTKRVPGRNLDDDDRERQRLIPSRRHQAIAVVHLPYTNSSPPVPLPHLSSQVESTSPLATSQYRRPQGIPQRL